MRQIGRRIIRWRVRRSRRPGRRRAVGHLPRNLVAARVHALCVSHVVAALRFVVRIAIGVAAGGAAEEQPRSGADRGALAGLTGRRSDDRARGGADRRAHQRACRGAVRGVVLRRRPADGGVRVLLARHLVRLELLEAFLRSGQHHHVRAGRDGRATRDEHDRGKRNQGNSRAHVSCRPAAALRAPTPCCTIARTGNTRRGRCSNTNSSTARPAAA